VSDDVRCRVAILYPGDREARQNASPEKSRFSQVFQALTALGVHAEPLKHECALSTRNGDASKKRYR
jgi:hypothetical protein